MKHEILVVDCIDWLHKGDLVGVAGKVYRIRTIRQRGNKITVFPHSK